jgi:lipopolysaccharide/colanic/teichoic acid biosynthesis glycosyltransferase
MLAKRIFDFASSLFGLLILLLPLTLIALLIKADSAGPVFFRQVRVGLKGKQFRIYKFRTMRSDAEKMGLQITVGRDPRITRIGTFLRKYKVDELPQLINVLLGEMSLVGPRPEVPRYVECYSESERRLVLSVRPGITDLASIEFRNENALLEGVDNPDEVYRTRILPSKMRFYLRYVETQSLWLDFKILIRTLVAISR